MNSLMEPTVLPTTFELPSVELDESKHLLSSIPDQRERLARHKGAKFTVIVTGESGTGKSTFIRSLFGSEYTKTVNELTTYTTNSEQQQQHPDLRHLVKRSDIHRTADIEVSQVELEEKGFTTKLTVIDTPGFGDYTNNDNTWVPVENYIDSQYRYYTLQEEQPERSRLEDTRVHLCLYFLSPTGRVSDLDIAAMKKLSERVNLVPIIGKADSLTLEDRQSFKELIRETLFMNGIKVWEANTEENSAGSSYDWPFSVVSSDDWVMSKANGKLVRGREYRWGIVEVENPSHSDFSLLKNTLIGESMLKLIDDTHNNFYLPQRCSLILHRLNAALNLNSDISKFQHETGETRKIMDRPSVSCMFSKDQKQLLATAKDKDHFYSDALEAAKSMSALTIISIISKIGAEFLESERLSKDAVLRQRAQALKSQFDVVTKFQQDRFVAKSKELQQLHEDLVSELKMSSSQNTELEKEIKNLEDELKRRR